MPTSGAASDPRNSDFVYQRFENGVLMYDASSHTTSWLGLGEYLKAVLTGKNLPPDLLAEASGSPLLAQYDPPKPHSLARPEELPGSDLTDAVAPDS